jgi:hypothetical protein
LLERNITNEGDGLDTVVIPRESGAIQETIMETIEDSIEPSGDDLAVDSEKQKALPKRRQQTANLELQTGILPYHARTISAFWVPSQNKRQFGLQMVASNMYKAKKVKGKVQISKPASDYASTFGIGSDLHQWTHYMQKKKTNTTESQRPLGSSYVFFKMFLVHFINNIFTVAQTYIDPKKYGRQEDDDVACNSTYTKFLEELADGLIDFAMT